MDKPIKEILDESPVPIYDDGYRYVPAKHHNTSPFKTEKNRLKKKQANKAKRKQRNK